MLHQIGSGVLGPVFRTFEPRQERLVAVKAFRLDVVPEVTARLADALRRVAATPIDHPAVVPVVDAGLEGMTAFVAYEYVTAETLDVTLRQLAPAPIEVALPLLRQIADAIEAAWKVGLGHGALHPRDVFVHDELGETSVDVRVAGFGVAQALERLQIKTPIRRPYAAPERAESTTTAAAWDMRADVYSLGVIAHELLTGRRPAGPGEQDGELPTGTSPEQRVAIRRALAGVLALDPNDRFATPLAFIEALTSGRVPDVATVAAGPTPGLPFDAEPGCEPEPAVEPEPTVEPKKKRSPESGMTRSWQDEPVRPVPGEPFRLSTTTMSPPAPPVTYSPPTQPAPAPLVAVVAVLALVVGYGLGYWTRGPASSADFLDEDAVGLTEVIDDVPVTGEPAPLPERDGGASVDRPPVVVTRGRMLIRSVPAGATVLINGRARGTTPATIRDLPLGTYNVTVSRAGYVRRVQRVTVSRAVPARDVTLELTRSAPAATMGSVMMETRPAGASVSVDGRALGLSPMLVPDLRPGRHTVRLALAGHKTLTTTVVVRAGQRATVKVSLEIQ